MSIRRRIAGLILLVGAILVGAKLLSTSGQLVKVDIRYLLPAGVTAVEVTVTPTGGGEPAATFSSRLGTAEVTQSTRLPPGAYVLAITLRFPSGSAHVERTVEVERRAAITVDLRDVGP